VSIPKALTLRWIIRRTEMTEPTPVSSMEVSFIDGERGRGAAELSIGDDRYLLDRDQLDSLIHVLIRMRRTIRQHDEREEHPGG
jgi:hypothetical protein